MRKLHDWVPNPLGYTNQEEHKVYDVWQDDFDQNWPWRLQGHGDRFNRVGFHTKEDAENIRDIMIEMDKQSGEYKEPEVSGQ